MIIGASFAGARSITATSGGGFCLMTEGLGYAGIAEIPIVIINAQRPGPATGLPTRTAQGDLQFVIRAAQDDFPCFVFAPGSPEEAFATSARALNLAEKYQVPAIILTDQFLNDSFYILDNRFKAPENIDYFVEDSGDDEKYRRYVLTPSGISPRALPCQGKSLVVCSGNEHSEDGHISESAENRNSMVKKRVRKQAGMLAEMRLPEKYHADANVLLVGWGSTAGIIKEAVDMMRDDNIDAGSLHFCDLWPFPAKAAEPVLRNADRFYVVECNSTGQFAQLLRQETGLQPAGNILKYDGRPFYPLEIYKSVKQMLV
jgi:2-oxoglutarate ferredoxin oxidoreductase subunit alpha